MGALEVGRGSSSRLGTAAGPRWLGYLLLQEEHLVVSGVVVQSFNPAIIALQLAVVHVEPPLGFGSAFFFHSSFFLDGQIYRCTT